jgi:hypothetical protein
VNDPPDNLIYVTVMCNYAVYPVIPRCERCWFPLHLVGRSNCLRTQGALNKWALVWVIEYIIARVVLFISSFRIYGFILITSHSFTLHFAVSINVIIIIIIIISGSAAQRGLWPSRVTRFLDLTQRRATVGLTPLDEWSARRRDLYLTTQQTSMLPVGSQQASGRRPMP